MPPIKNKLVNRSSGLYAGGARGSQDALIKIETKVDFIAPSLLQMIVPIISLIQDPENAREHPERNLEVIKQSLCLYGQVKPVVVRKATNVIIAGNGTHRAATELGWTKIAASFVDMSEVQAAGYGLVDNRSAELAKWNFKNVARLDKLLESQKHNTIGWTLEELIALRTIDFVEVENKIPDFQPVGINEQGKLNEKSKVKCPKCGCEF